MSRPYRLFELGQEDETMAAAIDTMSLNPSGYGLENLAGPPDSSVLTRMSAAVAGGAGSQLYPSSPPLCSNCNIRTATSRCLQCDEDSSFLCAECQATHNDLAAAYRNHETVLIADYPYYRQQQQQQQQHHSSDLDLDFASMVSGANAGFTGMVGEPPNPSSPPRQPFLAYPSSVGGSTLVPVPPVLVGGVAPFTRYFKVSRENFDKIYGPQGSNLNQAMMQSGTIIRSKNEALSPEEISIGITCLEIEGRGEAEVETAMAYLQRSLEDGGVNFNPSSLLAPAAGSLTSSQLFGMPAPSNIAAVTPSSTQPTANLPYTYTSSSGVTMGLDAATANSPQYAKEEMVFAMDIPAEKVKVVSGAKGILLKFVQKRSKTSISFDSETKLENNVPRRAEIKGTPANIAIARAMIQGIIENGPSSIDDFSEKLIMQTQASGQSNDGGMRSGSPRGSTTGPLSGPGGGDRGGMFGENNRGGGMGRDGGERNKGMGGGRPENSSETTVAIRCPADKISIVIGAKGVIINEISRRSNAQISIDEDPRNSIAETAKALLGDFAGGGNNEPEDTSIFDLRRIEIRGTPEEIEIAKTLIESVVASGPNVLYSNDNNQGEGLRPPQSKKSVEIACPKDKVGALIGSKGVIIKEIMRKSNTQISIAEEIVPHLYTHANYPACLLDSRMVTVRGYPEDLEVCRNIIDEIIGAETAAEIKSRTEAMHAQAAHAQQTGYVASYQHQQQQQVQQQLMQLQQQAHVQQLQQMQQSGQLQGMQMLPGGAVPMGQVMVGPGGQLPRGMHQGQMAMSATGQMLPPHHQQHQMLMQQRHFEEQVQMQMMMQRRQYEQQMLQQRQYEQQVQGRPYDEHSQHLMTEEQQQFAMQQQQILPPMPHQGTEMLDPSVSAAYPVSDYNNMSLHYMAAPTDSTNPLAGPMGYTHQDVRYQHLPPQSQLQLQAAMARNVPGPQMGKDPNATYWQYVQFSGANIYSTIMSRKELLQAAMNYCGATYSLNVSNEGDENSEVSMAVEGSKESVVDAVNLIHKLLPDIALVPSSNAGAPYKRFNPETFRPQDLTLEATTCPMDKTWLLFANRGANIKDIMRKSGTSITILKSKQVAGSDPKQVSGGSESDRNVILIGSSAGVQSAKALLAIFLEEAASDVNMQKGWSERHGNEEEVDFDEEGELDDEEEEEDDDTEGGAGEGEDELDQAHASIECPDDKVGLVIGFKGIVIKSMMKRSKAKIVVLVNNVNGKPTRVVEIKGTEAQVEAAKRMVECVIQYGSEALDQSADSSMALGIITKTLELHVDSVKALAGSLGPGFKLLMQRAMVTVSVLPAKKTEDPNLRRLTVKGTLAYVNNALNIIKDTMAQLNLEVYQAKPSSQQQQQQQQQSQPQSQQQQQSQPIKCKNGGVAGSSAGSAAQSKDSKGQPGVAGAKQGAFKGSYVNNNTTFSGIVSGESGGDDSAKGAAGKGAFKGPATGGGGAASSSANVVTITLPCPVSRVGTLIGTRGVIVKEVMKRSGASIVVTETTSQDPNDPSQEIRDVVIKGTKNAVNMAEKLAKALIEHGSKVLTKGYVLPGDEGNASAPSS